MRHFLIQTVEGHIRHDFAFHLVDATQYQNWYRGELAYDLKLSDEPMGEPTDIPVGSLEFVMAFMERYHEIPKDRLHPVNVPLALQALQWSGRVFQTRRPDRVTLSFPLFVKSVDRYKDVADIVKNPSLLTNQVYQFSEVVEFTSEWRAFVDRGELRGIQHYAGDFAEFPDTARVKQMIDAYRNAPPAYTLDVGKTEKGWQVVEVHPFVSCGLYGFRDYRALPQMMIAGFFWMVAEGKREFEHRQ